MSLGVFLIILAITLFAFWWFTGGRRANGNNRANLNKSNSIKHTLTNSDLIELADSFLYNTHHFPLQEVGQINMRLMQMAPDWAMLIRHFQIIADHLETAKKTDDSIKASMACINAFSELGLCDFSVVTDAKRTEYIDFIKKSIEPFSGYKTIGDTRVSSKSNFINSVDGMPNMFGSFSRSPNDIYWLVRQDSDVKRGVGGFRHSGHGRFALLKHGKLLCHGKCERPTDAVVSNTGIFAIDDTLFGSQLGAKLLVYASDCRLLFSHKFNANIFTMGISDSGNYVVAQLCNSDNDDANKLYLFDVNNKKTLFAVESTWPDSYVISEDERIVYLGFRDFPRRYRCTFDGEFLDDALFASDAIDKASGAQLFFLTQNKYNAQQPTNHEEINQLLDKSINTGLAEYPEYLAKAYRIKGEICEFKQEIKAAVEWYEKALVTHEKVGVKRKLAALKKKIEV